MEDKLERLAYSPTEAAAAAGVSRPTLYRWMHMDGFPVARLGGCTRIPARAFEAWLNRQAGVHADA
ncbi:helix-turn-helix domain-containing protein [uncultured Dysosmobacter sp.]|uniref:helix-turn-helix domain-containing protein n=1 Tax=uncultured Dysosmobacter sp. TaxID=2591384 RepID=UPI003414A4C8